MSWNQYDNKARLPASPQTQVASRTWGGVTLRLLLVTLYSQRHAGIWQASHLYDLLSIPFQKPLTFILPFAARIALTLLRMLSTRYSSMAVGICLHSATSALVRLRTDDKPGSLTPLFQFIPGMFTGVAVACCAGHSCSHQPWQAKLKYWKTHWKAASWNPKTTKLPLLLSWINVNHSDSGGLPYAGKCKVFTELTLCTTVLGVLVPVKANSI